MLLLQGTGSSGLLPWTRRCLLVLLVSVVSLTGHSLAQAPIGKLLAPAANSTPIEPPPSATPAAAGEIDPAIPLPQVADQAEELDRLLDSITRRLAEGQDATATDETIAAQAGQISARAGRIDSFLDNLSDILRLRDEVVYWRALDRQSGDERRQLSDRANQLQDQLTQLDKEQARWQATRDQIHDTAGIEVVAARVQQELHAIGQIRAKAREQLNHVLILQNQLAQSSRLISNSLAKLTEAEKVFRGHIFDRDSQPLWAPVALHALDQPITVMMRNSGDQDYRTAGEFFRDGQSGSIWVPVVYVLSLLASLRVKRHLGAIPAVSPDAHRILDRPYSLALLTSLIAAIPEAGTAPVSVTLVLYLLWLALVFRLAPVLVEAEFRSLLLALLAFNFLELVRVGLPFPALVNRWFLALNLAAAWITFAWLARPARLKLACQTTYGLRLLRGATAAGLLLLGVALAANVLGFVSLSHVLGVGTLLSAFLAVSLYCVVRVLMLLFATFLDSRWASSVSAETRIELELWGRRGLIVAAFLLWWTRSELYIFMLHDSLTEAGGRIFGWSFGIGQVRFTVGGTLTVALILVIGYGLAKGSTSLLSSILATRLPMQRGLPYAISKVTYYLLMLLVLTAAVTSAGVELNKFTVITGALGVGVGFGLQNIVSNFASGLILLFERPVRVGDTIEVNGLTGSVRRIGARSSTITTGQGAEVIVPNSNLLSNHVINWTLSSPWRRVEIAVGVAYGSDPERVIKLLAAVAAAHRDVMETPAPEGFFLGFGDSALNFELRFWSKSQDTWFQLKSEVTIGVSKALSQAGIEIPFPQRDLRLRGTDLLLAAQPAPATTDNSRGNRTEAAAGMGVQPESDS